MGSISYHTGFIILIIRICEWASIGVGLTNRIYTITVSFISCTLVFPKQSTQRIFCIPMQQASFHRQPVVIPLLLNMYQRPLSGTIAKMQYPRQHEHIIIVIHHLVYLSSSKGSASINRSKSLWNRRSCTMRYFSNSVSA